MEGPPFDGKPCPCCPMEIRNLGAVAHNTLTVWDDVHRRDKLPQRMEELRAALQLYRPLVDAHFADRRHSHVADVQPSSPPVDRSKLCTTDGRSPEDARACQTNETGQHASYIVLCEDERKKGFVRPYRDAYRHVGGVVETVTDDGTPAHAPRVGGCGTVTTMGRALSETYARDPKFYSHTFCVRCNRHPPVAEFVWTADGQEVGS
jgi:hypothetical protein